MKHAIYAVHSDNDEINVGQEFEGRGSKQAAISYAKRNRDEKTWVERIIFDTTTEEYEYPGDIVYEYLEDEEE